MRITTRTALLPLTLAIAGCSGSREPALAAYVCLTDPNDRGVLKTILRQTASRHGLHFGDLSAETEVELRTLAVPGIERSSPLINFRVWGSDGLNVQADNMGLPAEQVAIRFSQGRNAPKSQQIQERLVAQLRAKWSLAVTRVTDRQPFAPVPPCNDGLTVTSDGLRHPR